MTFLTPMILPANRGLKIDRSYVLCDDVAGSKQRKNVDHNLRLRTRKLLTG